MARSPSSTPHEDGQRLLPVAVDRLPVGIGMDQGVAPPEPSVQWLAGHVLLHQEVVFPGREVAQRGRYDGYAFQAPQDVVLSAEPQYGVVAALVEAGCPVGPP